MKTVKTEDLDLDVDNASHPTKREHAIPGAIKRDTAANIAGGKQVCVDDVDFNVVVAFFVVVNVVVVYAVPGHGGKHCWRKTGFCFSFVIVVAVVVEVVVVVVVVTNVVVYGLLFCCC